MSDLCVLPRDVLVFLVERACGREPGGKSQRQARLYIISFLRTKQIL